MDFLKYALYLYLILSCSASFGGRTSHDSGSGFTIISSQELDNTPVPAWIGKSKRSDVPLAELESTQGTLIVKAYPVMNGVPSPAITQVSGYSSVDLYNPTKSIKYYNLDEFLCVSEVSCTEYKLTIVLYPNGYDHHHDTLDSNVQLGKGSYENISACVIAGTENVRAIDVSKFDIL